MTTRVLLVLVAAMACSVPDDRDASGLGGGGTSSTTTTTTVADHGLGDSSSSSSGGGSGSGTDDSGDGEAASTGAEDTTETATTTTTTTTEAASSEPHTTTTSPGDASTSDTDDTSSSTTSSTSGGDTSGTTGEGDPPAPSWSPCDDEAICWTLPNATHVECAEIWSNFYVPGDPVVMSPMHSWFGGNDAPRSKSCEHICETVDDCPPPPPGWAYNCTHTQGTGLCAIMPQGVVITEDEIQAECPEGLTPLWMYNDDYDPACVEFPGGLCDRALRCVV